MSSESAKNYVVTLKLVNNEEIIALLVGEDDTNIKIDYPFCVRFDLINSSYSISPWSGLSADTTFTISKDKVVYMISASNYIADYYLSVLDSMNEDESDLHVASINTEEVDTVDAIKSVEDLDKLVDMLDNLLRKGKQDLKYEGLGMYFPGTNTKQ